MAGKNEKESALIRSALAVLIDRAGGSISYTQSEYTALGSKLGRYEIVGQVDRTQPGEPRIVVTLESAAAKAGDPVN